MNFYVENTNETVYSKVHYFYLLPPLWMKAHSTTILLGVPLCVYFFLFRFVCICRQWKWKVECISKHMLNNIDFLTYSNISIDTSNDERIDLVFAFFSLFFRDGLNSDLFVFFFLLLKSFALKWKFSQMEYVQRFNEFLVVWSTYDFKLAMPYEYEIGIFRHSCLSFIKK